MKDLVVHQCVLADNNGHRALSSACRGFCKRAGDDGIMPGLFPLPIDPRALSLFLYSQTRYDSKKPLRRREVIKPDPPWYGVLVLLCPVFIQTKGDL